MSGPGWGPGLGRMERNTDGVRMTGAPCLLVPCQAKFPVQTDTVYARRSGEGTQGPGAQSSALSRSLSRASKLISTFKKIS